MISSGIIWFVVTIIGSFFSSSTFQTEWLQFKAEHGKSYVNKHEEATRYSIFLANLKRIQNHNERFEEGLETYTMKMNRFGDMNWEELKSELSRQGLVSAAPLPASQEEVYLPSHVDWRTRGAVRPVMMLTRNTSNCCGSWAFSAAGALEGQLFLRNGVSLSLSEQNLLDCASPLGHNSCEEGRPEWAFDYVSKEGIQTEGDYPYEAKVGECKFQKEKSVLSGIQTIRIPVNERELRKAVANVGPISIYINAIDFNFWFYSSGIYNMPNCDNSTLNHWMLLVGYGLESGKEYWIVKNSWGREWGEQGYVHMSRNRDCGLASYAVYPKLSISDTIKA